jgi:peptidoglycan/xylan/chitin deacetylase (PgdA/CDA1 family)
MLLRRLLATLIAAMGATLALLLAAAVGAAASAEPELHTSSPAPASCPDPRFIPRTIARAERLELPILMYHHLKVLGPVASPVSRTLTVTPEALDEQLAFLVRTGYHTVGFGDLIAYFGEGRPLPDKPIILTFDDGWREAYTVAFPALRKHCLTGVFFPPTNWIDRSPLTLTWAQVEEMSRAGMEFGSHTANHYLLTNQTAEQITRQAEDSRAALAGHVQTPVVVLAYPGGHYNAAVAAVIKQAGYGAAVGVARGVTHTAADLFSLNRVTISYNDDLTAFAAKLAPAPAPSARPIRKRTPPAQAL